MSKNTKSAASKKSSTKTTSPKATKEARAKAIKVSAEEKKVARAKAIKEMVAFASKVLTPVEPVETTSHSEPAAPETVSKPAAEAIPQLKASTLESPSKAVWGIADEMHTANPTVRRVDVVRACVAKGIALNTAKTQYQRWFTAKKGETK
jgi:hypothetical protein